MARKWPAIDIMKLYSGTMTKNDNIHKHASWDDTVVNTHDDQARFKAHKEWNAWLSKCLLRCDMQELMKVRYGLQVGMSDLVKVKLDTPEIVDMFIRWTRSIEKTARQIVSGKHPFPAPGHPQYDTKVLAAKRAREIDLEEFFRESSF